VNRVDATVHLLGWQLGQRGGLLRTLLNKLQDQQEFLFVDVTLVIRVQLHHQLLNILFGPAAHRFGAPVQV